MFYGIIYGKRRYNMNLKDWMQSKVEFLSDKAYWNSVGSLINAMTPDPKINDEIEMYYTAKTESVLSPETIEFIKECVNMFKLNASYERILG